ncbi:MSCRAMM family protein [Levilactobacillus brevis]|uniref:MSCRAMM family protein n=1 Tax=Levilactobacillus brevis TaxID=1580 RepID=UPI0021A675FB|nr:SpaA isopeptide-forming pilin-related protein [Levilactobacillus brevis]MCT3584527.1 LPXTG cell wall anchor domain-containing protein [Levilactobacillus brevis]
MWKRIGLSVLGLVVTWLLLFSGQLLVAKAATDITANTTGLNAPSKIEEQTGDNEWTEVALNSKLEEGQNYRLTYSWSIADDVMVTDGDTASVTLPTTAAHGYVSFPVKTKTLPTTTVGNVELQNDKSSAGTITFNNELASTNVGRSGEMTFQVTGTSDSTNDNSGSTPIITKNGWVTSYNSDGIPEEVVWNIAFNSENKDLGTVTLTDDIGGNQTYVGPVSATDAAGNTVTPTVTVNGSEVAMVFKNVTSEISLTYPVSVDTANLAGLTQGNFSNYVGLNATSGDSGNASSGGSGTTTGTTGNAQKNVQWGGSATVDGSYIGSATLTKTDATDTAKTLSGAVYTLQKKNSVGVFEDYQTGLTTDSNGQIKAIGLETGDYQFVETKAPSGYLINQTPVQFSIATSDLEANHAVTQSDQKNSVILTKTDATSGEVLAGASYNLLNSDGSLYQGPLSTDSNGQITVSNLAPGTYKFLEDTAPNGYAVNTDPVSFTVTGNETAPITVGQTDVTNGAVTSSSSSNSSASTSSSSISSSSSSVPSSSASSSSSSEPISVASSSSSESRSVANSSTSSKLVAKVSSMIPSERAALLQSGLAADVLSGTSAVSSSATRSTGTVPQKRRSTNRYLPQTNEEQSLFVMLIGLGLFGISLSIWQWRRTHNG